MYFEEDYGNFAWERREGVTGLDDADFLNGITSGRLDSATNLESFLRSSNHSSRGREDVNMFTGEEERRRRGKRERERG